MKYGPERPQRESQGHRVDAMFEWVHECMDGEGMDVREVLDQEGACGNLGCMRV